MTLEQRIQNAKEWAVAMRKVRGSVSCTYQDGEIEAVATANEVVVTVNGIKQ